MVFDLRAFDLDDDHIVTATRQVQTIATTHGGRYNMAYALSWVLANQVIQRYYGSQGVDAIPVWKDDFGWTTIILPQAQGCVATVDSGLESQRYILLDGIAVNWRQSGAGNQTAAQYDFGAVVNLEQKSVEDAVIEAVLLLGLDNESTARADHRECLHGPLAYAYTKLFQVVTDLIANAPELVVKREIVIDLNEYGQPLAAPRHRLRVHNLAQPGITRDFFELVHVATNSHVFVNIYTGDMLYTEPDDTVHVLEYPGWNELNEEQLEAYLANLLMIALPQS